jgi:hypothetical protein
MINHLRLLLISLFSENTILKLTYNLKNLQVLLRTINEPTNKILTHRYEPYTDIVICDITIQKNQLRQVDNILSVHKTRIFQL